MNPFELDRDLLSLLPPWYREVADYQEICQVEEQQLTDIAGAVSAVAGNFFFQTMDEGAAAQWERILGIVADPAVETLEFRRARLISRLSTKPPFTIRFLHNQLNGLVGPGNWEVSIDYPNYHIYIEIQVEGKSYLGEVAYLVNKIKPAHMTLKIMEREYTATPIYMGTLPRQGDKIIWEVDCR